MITNQNQLEVKMSEWSGRLDYTEANVRKYAPTAGGVYRLVYKKDANTFTVFYVGQSDNLERRLLEHLADSESDACIKRHLNNYSCYFRYLGVSTQSERDKAEQQQISEYSPSCNN